MKRSILFGLYLCLFHSLSAQDFRFGLTLNGAKSTIESNFSFPDNYFIYSTFSGKFGATVEKKLTQSSALGMELLWVIMEGKEYLDFGAIEWSFTSSGGVNYQEFLITDRTYIHSHYIGVPAYYRHSFGRISIKGGLQALILWSINLEKPTWKTGIAGAEAEPIYNFDDADEINFRKYDLGPQVGIEIKLTDHLRLRSDLYYGLTNLYAEERVWRRKNRQFSFGLNYWFGEEEG